MQVHAASSPSYHNPHAPETCVSNASSSALLLQVIDWTTRPILSQTILAATAGQTLRDVHSHQTIVFNANAHHSQKCHQRLRMPCWHRSVHDATTTPTGRMPKSLVVALTSRDGCAFTIDYQPHRATLPCQKYLLVQQLDHADHRTRGNGRCER